MAPVPPTAVEPDEPTGLSRREMLSRSAQGGLGLALSGSLGLLFGGPAAAHGRPAGYGPLIPDPAGILSLPQGFHYSVIAESGVTRLETGEPTPADPDGSAAFPLRRGGTALIVNHEISGSDAPTVPTVPDHTFNPAAGGGTTTIEVDARGRRVREYVSLAGTVNNCAGGRSPWGTWLTCEETEATVAGVQHGWVFEVDPYDQRANRAPKPIKALGRFSHESVAVDPLRGVIYETEDAGTPNGLFYRWTPPRGLRRLGRGVLRTLPDDAGTLEALRALRPDGTFVPDLSPAREVGTRYRTRWVTVPDRFAATTPTRKQAYAEEPTRSRKLEGMWWGDGGCYFVCSFARTADGSAGVHDGQVWFLDPRAQTIELKIHFEYTPDQDGDADGPDNITVSPYGGLVIAEDGEGASHLVGSTASGETFFLARNELAGESEFTGSTFSADRRTLFANVQSPGHVFAITGPFRRQR
ncbi:alkaline phosphatase PhoX [Paraconexibacter algicola]|nr:alkaline phosphatase PhoX [Paraconexibacter algicola]